MKNLSFALVMTSLFGFGCEQQNTTERSNDVEQFAKVSFDDVPDQEILQDLLEEKNSEDLSQFEALLSILQVKYDLNAEETHTLFMLQTELNCSIAGIETGSYEMREKAKFGHHGKWQTKRLSNDFNIIQRLAGKYKVNVDGGLLSSSSKDAESQAHMFMTPDTISYIGKWREKKRHGEFIGLQLDNDRRSMLGLWTECD